jgi:hypothetical protein
MPIHCNLNVANHLQLYLQWEQKLPITDTRQHQKFIRPLALFPHLEARQWHTSPPGLMHVLSASTLEAYRHKASFFFFLHVP